jgi:hypothetical protein
VVREAHSYEKAGSSREWISLLFLFRSPALGYLSTSVRYLHLFADNLVMLNSRHADAFVGMIGVNWASK